MQTSNDYVPLFVTFVFKHHNNLTPQTVESTPTHARLAHTLLTSPYTPQDATGSGSGGMAAGDEASLAAERDRLAMALERLAEVQRELAEAQRNLMSGQKQLADQQARLVAFVQADAASPGK